MASVYVYLGRNVEPTAVSTHEIHDGINIDYDHRGKPIGVEILGATRVTVDGAPDED